MDDEVKTDIKGEILQRMRETIVAGIDEFAKTRMKVPTKLFDAIDWQISMSQTPLTTSEETKLMPNECVFFIRMSENGAADPRVLVMALALTASGVKECPIFNRMWEGFASRWIGSPTANTTSGDNADLRAIEKHMIECLDDAVTPLMATTSDEEDIKELNRHYDRY
jgi:hypothetical protein